MAAPTRNTSFATATGSLGFSGAVVILLLGVLNHFKIELDATQTAAMITVLSPIVHRITMKFGIEDTPASDTPAAVPATEKAK